MKQHHTIKIFSANCPLCRHITDDIEIGKCEGCSQTVYDVNNMTEWMKDYGVKAVPTTIIDGKIKIVGIPDFPWVCGEYLYRKLKQEYPFMTTIRSSNRPSSTLNYDVKVVFPVTPFSHPL